MSPIQKIFVFLLLFVSVNNYAQLGFCPGSKGDPVFTENFGNGTNAGPALPAGTTTYGFSPVPPNGSVGPNDGLYTIQNTCNFYNGNWHNAPDHTPDATNGPNGKMLIVNAAYVPGDFYKKTVTGLCVNTTFEFSAWLMNVFKPTNPGNCAPDIPFNVRFEIWNSTETVRLAWGDTGAIYGTPTPIWQQFALVFTTVSDTSVILKMKNNGGGGCGNDVAIDDISFAACGDLTTVASNPATPGNVYSDCNPASLQLNAATSGASTYFYQWQTSTDGITWTDISGATNATYNTPSSLTTQTYFRVKAAQDAVNLANPFCSTVSNLFTINISGGPSPAVSNGDQVICSDQPIPALSVATPPAGISVNWYSALTGGTLLQANSTTYTPTAAGNYYAQTYNTTTNCVGTPRTLVKLTITSLPTASVNGNPLATGSTYTTCDNPASLQLNAVSSGSAYQWEQSTDSTTWTTIAGANSATYTPSVTTTTYFRVKVAQDTASLTSNFCVTVSNVFTISILTAPTPAVSNGDQVICSDQTIPALSVTPPAGTRVDWYNALTGGTLLLANSASYTPTVAGIYYAQTYVSATCFASPRTAVELSITTLPTVSINALPGVPGNSYATCDNPASLQLNAVASGGSTYYYQWQSSTDGTTWTDITGAHNASYNAITTGPTTYFRVKVAQDATSLNSNFCTATSNIFTITILPAPNSAVSNGDQVICNNQPIPTLSVTPPAGTGVNWYNALTGGTLLLANSASYTPATAGTYYAETYDLVSNCKATPRTLVKLTIAPLPTVSINALPLVVGTSYATCNNPASLQLNAIASGGSTYYYQWQTSTDGTTWTNITGANGAVHNASTTNPTTYLRVKVAQDAASLTANFCTTTSNVFTITILPAPSPAISNGDQIICSNQPIPALSVTPPAGTGINWYNALTGGTLLLANSAAYTPALAGTYYAETYDLVSNCKATPRTAVKLTIATMPTATINALPLVICSNQASVIQFRGTPNAVITYTVGSTNQSVTLNAAGVADVPTGQLTASTTYQLNTITLAGCSQSIPGSVTVSVTQKPVASFVGPLVYCNEEVTTINLLSTIAGTTFGWTAVRSGTVGAASGAGNQITETATLQQNDTAGTVTYTVTPFNNGCPGDPITISVAVNPLPVPAITDGVICTTGSTQTSYILDTNLTATGHTFQWFFGGSLIPGASGNTYAANQIGVYSVVATSTAGCVSDPVTATVGQMPQGENLIIEQSAAFSDNQMVTITVIGGGGPFYYQLDGSAFQSSNVFQNIASGTHTITVIDDFCTNLTATVTLLDYPRFFTPNNDGYHDKWNISGIDNGTISIFDRYGKLIKQISTNGLGWDGTYNGRLLPSTDYWFTLDYTENGGSKTFKAHFTLKR